MSKIKVENIIVRRLRPGVDLLEELTKFAQRERISLGKISGIGALRRASVGYFVPQEKKYRVIEFGEQLEICSLTGNISFKDGLPFVHAHIILSDSKGRAFGGHLMPGCPVFVAEVIIWKFAGPPLERKPQADMGGLALWPVEDEA